MLLLNINQGFYLDYNHCQETKSEHFNFLQFITMDALLNFLEMFVLVGYCEQLDEWWHMETYFSENLKIIVAKIEAFVPS